jgi:hypothetical protein
MYENEARGNGGDIRQECPLLSFLFIETMCGFPFMRGEFVDLSEQGKLLLPAVKLTC